MNEEAWQQEYREHVERLTQENREWQSALPQAVRAAWVREEANCDVPDAGPLSAPLPLSDKEFRTAVSLLQQARPMPALPGSAFRKHPHDALNGQGKIVCAWHGPEMIPESEIKNWDSALFFRPTSYLPDQFYEQMLRIPSSQRAKKTDKELRSKLHCADGTRAEYDTTPACAGARACYHGSDDGPFPQHDSDGGMALATELTQGKPVRRVRRAPIITIFC